MIYIKPELLIKTINVKENIAQNGMSGWLEEKNYTNAGITTKFVSDFGSGS